MGYPFWNSKKEAEEQIKDFYEYGLHPKEKFYVVKVKLAPNHGFLNAPQTGGTFYTYSVGKNREEAIARIKRFPEFKYKPKNKVLNAWVVKEN